MQLASTDGAPTTNGAAQRYRTIVADPPWEYPEGFLHGRAPGWRKRDGLETRRDISRRPLPFSQLSVDAICDLPIGALAESDAALFLWTTNRYLPESFRVATAWGFTYRQALVWDKAGGTSPFGGTVAPNQAEFLLVCRRGEHRWAGRWPNGVVSKSRTRHSAKPEVFLDLVESVSPGPYLELFARRQRLGWDTWGNEALAHVELGA